MRYFEYRHVVGFQETNLVGNVYYANYVSWQGRCRELFLKTYTPELVQRLYEDLSMVTTRVSCEYINELYALDEVSVRMMLGEIQQNRISMRYDYYRLTNNGEELVARGEQQIACMKKTDKGYQAVPVPTILREALQKYQ